MLYVQRLAGTVFIHDFCTAQQDLSHTCLEPMCVDGRGLPYEDFSRCNISSSQDVFMYIQQCQLVLRDCVSKGPLRIRIVDNVISTSIDMLRNV